MCVWAFIDILNLVILSKNIVELNMWLIEFEKHKHHYGKLSASFHWEFSESVFSLWQRMDYGSPECFANKVLQISFLDILFKDESVFEISLN